MVDFRVCVKHMEIVEQHNEFQTNSIRNPTYNGDERVEKT